MELYEGVSRRMGLPEVMIRGSMEYMAKSRIFIVTFLGQFTISMPDIHNSTRRDDTEEQDIPLFPEFIN